MTDVKASIQIQSNEMSDDEFFEATGDFRRGLRDEMKIEATLGKSTEEYAKGPGLDILTLLISSGALATFVKYLFAYLNVREDRLKGQSIHVELDFGDGRKKSLTVQGASDPEEVIREFTDSSGD